MAHFKKVTTETTEAAAGKVNAVIMGRKTWDSIPERFRPLEGRTNVVLTRNFDIVFPPNVIAATSLPDAVQKLEKLENLGAVFVIGGEQIYQQAMEQGIVNKIIYTEVSNVPENVKFDAFFPSLDDWEVRPLANDDKENGPLVDPKSGILYRFLEYTKKRNTEEQQYLDLCQEILETGIQRGDRTGTGTLSKFGTQMRFSLRNGTLPLLTTKRTFWRGVAEELLWFISVGYQIYSFASVLDPLSDLPTLL